jgi:hypothetical protein
MNSAAYPLTAGAVMKTVLVVNWLLPVIPVVAIVTTSGTGRVVASIAAISAAVYAVAATRSFRREAIVIDGSRIGRRSGWTGRVRAWTELGDVVDIDVSRRSYYPRGLVIVLWSTRPGKVHYDSWGLVHPSVRGKIKPNRQRGILPLVVPILYLNPDGRSNVLEFLARGGYAVPDEADRTPTWS